MQLCKAYYVTHCHQSQWHILDIRYLDCGISRTQHIFQTVFILKPHIYEFLLIFHRTLFGGMDLLQTLTLSSI